MSGESAVRSQGEAVALGRRERSMQKKQLLIFEAATILFAERGFDGVTTQEISERADVAAGTLFRYAASKSELLIMVHNERFRRAFAAGEQQSAHPSNPTAAICTLLSPILAVGAEHGHNAALYQRELIFGSPTERYRSEGLDLVQQLEAAIAHRLLAAVHSQIDTSGSQVDVSARQIDTNAGHAGSTDANRAAARAARSIFAVLHLLLAQPTTGAHPDSDATEELRAQVAQIVDGFTMSIRRLEATPRPND